MKLDLVKLDDMLLDRCWSMSDLSRHADLSAATISKLMSGINKNPARLTVAKIAKALDVSPRELMLQE